MIFWFWHCSNKNLSTSELNWWLFLPISKRDQHHSFTFDVDRLNCESIRNTQSTWHVCLSWRKKYYKTVPIFLGFLTYIFQFSEFYWRYNCNQMFEMHYLFQCWITSAWYIRLRCRELQQRKENYKDMWKCRRNQNRFFSPSSCLPIWRGNSNRGSASC
jgi:hypothetical protein